MSDIKDEEDILQEEYDMLLTDEELERHPEYDDFEMDEVRFWNNEPVIYDRVDLDFDENETEEERDEV